MKETIVRSALAGALVLELAMVRQATAAEATETPLAYVEKHIQAIGGRERLQEIKSQVIEFQAQEGKDTFDLEVDLKPGHKVLLKASLPNGFRILQGTTGNGLWWRKDPEGVREFNRPQDALEFRELSFCLDVTAPLDLERESEQLKLVGQQKLGDLECQVMEYRLTGGLALQLWFDLKSGLLVKVGQSALEEYRAENGIKLPHAVRKSVGSAMSFKSVKFNVA
ncbi:MAG TPA: hypothetical protein VHI52_12075, partial [Verrucomicrobiae bacterium]|nr:hypothetical protein [Verrucomicrobiae bacterium]